MPIFRNTPGLLEQFRRGSREAMERVYWEYCALVSNVVRRGFRLKDERNVPAIKPEHLEDVVQEIFAKAFSERARLAFDGLREYRPFLLTLARNVVVDWARKQGREISLEDLGGNLVDEASPEDDGPWADPMTAALVESYLSELSPELAAVHHHRYVLGQPQRVVAKALRLSRQQLRTRENQLREGLERALSAPAKSASSFTNQKPATGRIK